jgi:flagellar biogenesis protein FliO
MPVTVLTSTAADSGFDSGTALTSALVRVFLFLLVAAAAYFAARFLARTRRARWRGAGLKVLEAAGVAPGASVAVVKAGGRYFLLGCAKESVALIAELDSADFGGTGLDEKKEAPISVGEYLSRFSPKARKENRNGKTD